MANRDYRVREGFNYPIERADSKGNKQTKTFDAGEILTLPEDIGDAAHQLERAGKKEKAGAEPPAE